MLNIVKISQIAFRSLFLCRVSIGFLLFSSSTLIAQDLIDEPLGGFTGGLPVETNGDIFEETRTLILRPQMATQEFSSRLFPSADRRQSGNAAPIYLRSNFEAVSSLAKLHKLRNADIFDVPLEKLDLQFVDENAAFRIDELRRAAYRENSGWEYPFDEIPTWDITLPDVSGSREYATALAAKARACIKRGELEEAEDLICILNGLGRHIGDTPLFVCQDVVASHQRLSRFAFEELIQHPDSSNYYWDLAHVEGLSKQVRRAVQMEMAYLNKTFPRFREMEGIHDEEAWSRLLIDVYDRILKDFDPLPQKFLPERGSEEYAKFMKDWSAQSRTRFQRIHPELKDSMEKMSDPEIGLRYLWERTEEISKRVAAPVMLELPMALSRTAETEKAILAECEDDLLVKAAALSLYSQQGYVEVVARSEQSIAILQTVEAIRDWSATHDGRLPETLDELDLPAPLDPAVNSPFRYVLADDRRNATLRTSAVGSPPLTKPRIIRYILTIAE